MSDTADVADLTESQEDDTGLVRHLRSKLKDAARELAELRVQQPDQGEQSGEGDKTPAGLRQALNRAQSRIRELEGAQRAHSLKATFDAAGVPEGALRDLIGAKVEDVDAVTVEWCQDFLRDNGVMPFDPVAAHRTETTRRVDDLRAGAEPVGSTRLGYGDFQQLNAVDPSAAAQALADGQVELPSHVARQIEANRAERGQRGVFGE